VMAKGFAWEEMNLEPFAAKWRAFGWEVLQVDGHDVEALLRVFHKARYVRVHGAPVAIVAHTVKGRGLSETEFNYKWHTQAPDPEQADAMLRRLARNYGRPEEGYSRLNDPAAKEKFYGGE
jgi:transketolase